MHNQNCVHRHTWTSTALAPSAVFSWLEVNIKALRIITSSHFHWHSFTLFHHLVLQCMLFSAYCHVQDLVHNVEEGQKEEKHRSLKPTTHTLGGRWRKGWWCVDFHGSV